MENTLGLAEDKIRRVLPPNTVDPDRFWAIASGLVRSNADIQKCTAISVVGAIHSIARLGLVPDPTMGFVYVVPFKGRATVIIGYRGFIELGRRGGGIDTVETEVVYENDDFDFQRGTNTELTHRPWYVVGAEGPGDPRLVYCITTFGSDRKQYEVMTAKQVRAIQTGGGPWRQHWDEMARKTVIRRASKTWPLTTELSQAVALDERAERGEVQPVSPQLDDDRFPAVGAAEDDQTLGEIIDAETVDPTPPDDTPEPAPVAGEDEINF